MPDANAPPERSATTGPSAGGPAQARTAHIINHTHWDREWFLSAVYTTHWIPRLIDRLLAIEAANPDFRYLFDGQTLVIEDLLKAYPAYRPKIDRLVRRGNLTIGPYYCQPDWKLTCGESLYRNLEYGRKDAAAFGGTMDVGWLVDTFGHISQAPQIHTHFGIENVFVWRGMPLLAPYFTWQGADDTTLFGVDLFGGYRNLYGVTHAPEVALRRLDLEVSKLAPYYPTPDIPLFDGYDLEDDPEDSVTFLRQRQAQAGGAHRLVEATPAGFVVAVRPQLVDLPSLRGELNSGKYGAVFPGVYSTRVYSKIAARDCANALYRWAEPLAVLAWHKGRPYAADQYEAWSRLLLQNDVHDVICGVSVDQVHEKAEDIYRRVFDGLTADIAASLAAILHDFAPGDYAISAVPSPAVNLWVDGATARLVSTPGVGVTPLPTETLPVNAANVAVADYTCDHPFGSVRIQADGTLALGAAVVGQLVVSAEHGDTYSDETGATLGVCRPSGPITLVEHSPQHARLTFACRFTHAAIAVSADVTITIEQHGLIRWEIALDSTGADFRVEFICQTGLDGAVWAGMPFDVVARPFVDEDLLPRELGAAGAIFMGQRELNAVYSFPCHDFVAIDDGARTAALCARGVYAYRAGVGGRIALTLRRSVAWLTRSNLANRTGDAGPFFYVPDARCERRVVHELALIMGDFRATSAEMQQRNAAFQNPPLIVMWDGHGGQTAWRYLTSAAPLSSLRLSDGQPVARLYNPTPEPLDAIPPKKIVSRALSADHLAARRGAAGQPQVYNPLRWRVGPNHGRPDEAEIDHLHAKMAAAQAAKEQAEDDLARASGDERYRAQHRVYLHHREMLEYQLSAHLNRLKLAQGDAPDAAYLYTPDPAVSVLGRQLNQLRIKRRIYDYVVAALPAAPT